MATNEWEFQGQVLTWLNAEIKRRPGLGLDRATQEPSTVTPKRNDLVVWVSRQAEEALLCVELKTPLTPISSPTVFADAEAKARRWGAPFFAIWNMQSAELYRSSLGNRPSDPTDRLFAWEPDPLVRDVSDWLTTGPQLSLQRRTLELLDRAVEAHLGGAAPFALEGSVFVDRVSQRILRLRNLIRPALVAKLGKHPSTRRRLNALAAAQGMLGFVADLDSAVGGQYAYRIVGQILFYFALRRRQPRLPFLAPEPGRPLREALEPFWNEIRRFDYEALYQPGELDEIVPLPADAETLVRAMIREFSLYDWGSLRDDVLGSIFENLIPREEQVLLGEFYTPPRVADLIVGFTLRGDAEAILDPGCGSGTFLMRSYEYLHDIAGLDHAGALSRLWGFDISSLAAELAAINLFRQDLSSYFNFPRIVPGNFFDRRSGETVSFPPAKAGGPEKVPVPIPRFDVVVGNPPYLRSQNQDDLDPKYKKTLFAASGRNRVEAESKTDLFAFFIYKSLEMMKSGGRLGFVTSSSWLTAAFGTSLKKLLFDRLRLVALVASDAEPFFSQVAVNAAILIVELREKPGMAKGEILRFVTLKRPLEELFPTAGPDYWRRLQRFTDRVEAEPASWEDDDARVLTRIASDEKAAIDSSTEPRNWSLFLRAPLTYFDLLEKSPGSWVRLDELAKIGLGYKSLQNNFFYVTDETIASYGIEKQFLKPILLLGDLNGASYMQASRGTLWLFSCDLAEADLRGTGALRYIRAMASRPATMKKQGSRLQSMKEALSAQGGGLWYAPKARPHREHIWLRKAFASVFAPFLFDDEATVDQRCNYISAKDGVSWRSLGALVSSSVFALCLECNGAASMGAGALEVATRQLSALEIPDLRRLSASEGRDLIALAGAVWRNDKPFDWRSKGHPGKSLQALDNWLLKYLGVEITTSEIYRALRETCASRFRLAENKGRVAKSVEIRDIEALAETIAGSIRLMLEGRQFPEAFGERQVEDTFPIDLSNSRRLSVKWERFFGETRVLVTDCSTGSALLDTTYANEVAEVIIRALLMGRRSFVTPAEASGARAALLAFRPWAEDILLQLEEGCSMSAVGTRFEHTVRVAALRRLELHEGFIAIEPPRAFEV